MRWRFHVVIVAAVAVQALGWRADADVRRFTARVFLDRSRPEVFLPVADFKLAAERAFEPAVQHLLLKGKDGTFRVPFEVINQIEFLRLLDIADDIVRFEARITYRAERRPRIGLVEVRAMEGVAEGLLWHQLLAARPDRGAGLFKIVFPDAP